MAWCCYMVTVVALLFSGCFQKWEVGANNVPGPPSGSDAVCNTPECISTAASMIRKMNLSADPCQDFNEYACGRYIAETDIPDGKASISPLSALEAENMLFVGDIINRTEPNEAPYMSIIRRYFRSCLNEDQIETIGLTPFLNDHTFTDDWPTLNPNWNETSFNLTNTISRYFPLFVAPLFDIYFIRDLGGSTIGLYITPPNPKVDVSAGKSTPEAAAYLNYLIEFAVALNASREVAERDANLVVDLEVQLAQVTPAHNFDLRKLYNPITLKQAHKLYPILGIPRALRALYSRVGMTLEDYDRIIIMYPTYMKQIESVLACHSKRAVQSLFGFYYALSRLEGLTLRMRQLKLELDQQTEGTESETPTWERCIESTSEIFDRGISKQFVTRKFSETGKNKINAMIAAIKEAFGQMIDQTTWLGNSTKREAHRKLAAMHQRIGYPDEDFDDEYITRLYENLTITEENFYNNRFIGNQHNKLEEIALYGEHTNKSQWPMAPYETGAFYTPNEMVVTAGAVQAPFFSVSYPNYYTYGSMGLIIGHEITHGFDSRGKSMDGDALLKDWWTTEDEEQFDNRTSCIENQFSQFHIDEINTNIDGGSVQEEAEAEIGGLKSSLRAYRQYVLRHGPEPTLPDLNLSQEQLYFLAYAQTICQRFTAQGLTNHLSDSQHPPGKYRINGALQNSEDFATAYGCSPNSYMNPERKCSVW